METPVSGLTAADVAERIARGEGNRIRRSEFTAYLAVFARNLFTLFNALVFPAAVALFLLREWGDAFAVSGMALTNFFLGLIQEVRAKRHLDRLTLLAETRVRVLRDKEVRAIPSGDVVRDDVLFLSPGDSIVVDGTVIESRYLEVDEALLTGESDPVPRRLGELLLSGSFCVAGEGAYRADRVGDQSFAQHTAGAARAYRYAASPIQVSINRLLVLLTAVALALCIGYGVMFGLGVVSHADLWKMIAATITSMVPQGLVVMTTFAFVLGAVRLSRRGALVQRLNAVETMASIDTLCMDKTGTLTTNRLHLETLLPLDTGLSEMAIRERLQTFAWASLDRNNKSVIALREALDEKQVDRLDQLPFKSQNRYSAVRVRCLATERVLVLGACESLQPFLDSAHSWETRWGEQIGSGLRLLLFAESTHSSSLQFAGSLKGFTLRPLALVGLRDELRPEARSVLEELAQQGIQFLILSGDHAETVRATLAPLTAGSTQAALLALADTPVASGDELLASSEPDTLIRSHRVFGRLSPAQKVQIIEVLRKQGRRVGMIGDGVNDVLAIKKANLGIALGDGASASKNVAGLVLETNDFALLPKTLDEGRVIVRNLGRAGKLFLVKNVYTLVLVIGALGVLGLPFPYLPRQVTLLNFLTIGVPAFLIMLDRDRSSSASGNFLRELIAFAMQTGLVIGLAGLLLLWLSNRIGHDEEKTLRTLLLSLLVVCGVTTLLRVVDNCAMRTNVPFRFSCLAACAFFGYLAMMYSPPLNDFFALVPLTLLQWIEVIVLAACTFGVLRWFIEPTRNRYGLSA